MPSETKSIAMQLYEVLEEAVEVETHRWRRSNLEPQWIERARVLMADARGEQPQVQDVPLEDNTRIETLPPEPISAPDYLPPVDRSEFRHPFEPVQGNVYCGKCGGGKLHGIHQGGYHAR